MNQVESLLESLTPEAGKQSASANKLQTRTFTSEEEKESAASISKLQNENLARSLSASSIPAYLNIVRILHLEHGLEDPTKNNFHLATTLRGISRCKGCTVSQKQPMTPATLLAIKSHYN